MSSYECGVLFLKMADLSLIILKTSGDNKNFFRQSFTVFFNVCLIASLLLKAREDAFSQHDVVTGNCRDAIVIM